MPLPQNRLSPCDCKGGWFYVNEGSITVLRDLTSKYLPKITRAQLKTALKLMRKRK